MNTFRKILIPVILAIFLLVSNVFAGDLIVNKNTTHNDIDTWMKNPSTVKGNNFIFTTTKYELTDTVNVSKAVTIKSNVKTQINFNKNKNMFNISASGITFSGLTLNHNGKGNAEFTSCLIFSNDSKQVININNMNFHLNNEYLCAIGTLNWKENVTNSIFKSKGNNNFMFIVGNWTGNVYKSTMSFSNLNCGIFVFTWVGNFSYSKMSFFNSGMGISAINWVCNFYIF